MDRSRSQPANRLRLLVITIGLVESQSIDRARRIGHGVTMVGSHFRLPQAFRSDRLANTPRWFAYWHDLTTARLCADRRWPGKGSSHRYGAARIRKIKGLLALPRPHLSSAPGAGEAVPAEEGERRRAAVGDSRRGKSMGTQEGTGAAVCATPSRRAQGLRDLIRWRQLRRPSHMRLGEYGQALWRVDLQPV